MNIYIYIYMYVWASLVAQMVKNLPEVLETQVRSLGQEDPLEKEMATHSNILAWRTPWTEEPVGLQSMDHKESDRTNTHSHTHIEREESICFKELTHQLWGWTSLKSVGQDFCCSLEESTFLSGKTWPLLKVFN